MMTFRDYVEQVRADAEDAIAEGSAWHEDWEDMLDALYIDDAVTGNGSGSYTFSAARALDNVRGLLGDGEFMEEASACGYGIELFGEYPESIDVIARCIALGRISSDLEGVYEASRNSGVE